MDSTWIGHARVAPSIVDWFHVIGFIHFFFPGMGGCPFLDQVRWAIANEAHIKGSLDRACQQQFPEYCSRRLSHWRRQYVDHNWEGVPNEVAAKISQLPNKFKAEVGASLKGPKATNYQLPSEVEDELVRQGL